MSWTEEEWIEIREWRAMEEILPSNTWHTVEDYEEIFENYKRRS